MFQSEIQIRSCSQRRLRTHWEYAMWDSVFFTKVSCGCAGYNNVKMHVRVRIINPRVHPVHDRRWTNGLRSPAADSVLVWGRPRWRENLERRRWHTAASAANVL